MLSKVQGARHSTYSAQIFKHLRMSYFQEYLMEILSHLGIEFLIAPQDSTRQLAYLYANDYCECVVADLEMILFDKKVP